ncbi:3-oxo-5-alpha-steroid 4-dehydrogenase-domain-containing protein [Mucor mucedo]|uniref:3-oxo-5-alpha-steroid 4-dehydrogenase-domain-containing protein n=1 Tax=Mucor mucedo TaxID=29922 RepID=UPI00221EB143|nr:3-oxo-5-alpha-steroid 4-dehydrogenase-domain-containing protein [Mucor mucedo]KAI7894003.1 3-oxo-5-alpha-steroid 4-dehydrogenase-domain-containing protein [Mucor mucedo]
MFYYPDWTDTSNVLVTLLIVIGSTCLVLQEYYPDSRMGYSKFNKHSSTNIPSLYGMLVIYVPSFLVSIYILLYQSTTSHLFKISLMSFLHYFKRVYEVLFLHKYSGQTVLKDCICISSSYVGYAVIVNLFSRKVPHVTGWNECMGILLFVLGESINAYHHTLLRRLRSDGSTKYKIPEGGLFKFVWCPHYVGEIITFIGMVFMTQHFLVLLLQVASAAYLAVRAYNTRAWYQQTFKQIPIRACLLPGVF